MQTSSSEKFKVPSASADTKKDLPSDGQGNSDSFRMSPMGLFVPVFLQFFAWMPTTLLFKFFVRFHVDGRKHLRQFEKVLSKEKNTSKGVIFVANHASELDPIVVRAALPLFMRRAPLFYVARGGNYYNTIKSWRAFLYGGAFFRMWGAYPAYSGLKSYEKSLKHHIKLLKKGKRLLIFPEGKMTRDGELGEAHGGVAYLAHTLGLHVIPVSIKGAYDLSARDFLKRRGQIHVRFGKPLSPEEIFTKSQLERELTHEEYREASWFVLSQTR
jgi:1-acyl-sn-glycerol-3-phosphate acyltransferase